MYLSIRARVRAISQWIRDYMYIVVDRFVNIRRCTYVRIIFGIYGYPDFAGQQSRLCSSGSYNLLGRMLLLCGGVGEI